MNNLSGAFVGSLIGAVVGCLAWVGVGYASGYELGILAVLVGLVVGIGAAMGAKGRAGTSGAVIASLVTVIAIVAARHFLIQLAITRDISEARAAISDESPGPDDADHWTAFLADRIVKEREAAGRAIDWPIVDEDQQGNPAAEYPADIWNEARQSWESIPESQRKEFRTAAIESLLAGHDSEEADYRAFASVFGMLLSNLHPMSLVLMGIAVAAAFRGAKHSTPVEGGLDQNQLNEINNSTATLPQAMAATQVHPSSVSVATAKPISSAVHASPKSPATPTSTPAKSPPRPTRKVEYAAFDESQLPPQFRNRPAED